MSSDYKIISKSYLTIFKIFIKILLILTSALKMFINRNEKQSVLFIKTAIIDVN